MKKVILTRGLPGCGKSTWAKSVLDANPGAYKRVNKDDLRLLLDNNHYTTGNEKFVLALRDHIIEMSLEAGKHVIVDDTNLHPKHEARIRQLVKGKAEVEIKDFTDVPIEVCIQRDLQRLNSVGERVIRTMYNQYLKAQTVSASQNPALPRAILCDLDGTLALLNGRNPYDAANCHNDEPNQSIAQIVSLFAEKGREIIFCSGREDKFREQTVLFLNKTFGEGAFPYQLLMRKTGDNRKDSIIKREIYDQSIRDKFYVEFILDDRNQVVDMWRNELGLLCLQVDYGDF